MINALGPPQAIGGSLLGVGLQALAHDEESCSYLVAAELVGSMCTRPGDSDDCGKDRWCIGPGQLGCHQLEALGRARAGDAGLDLFDKFKESEATIILCT